MILKSRYVVPVDGPPIENGAIVIHRDRITAVGSARDLTASPVLDYGDAVICPAFVNAHTHLELSLLAGKVSPGSDFIDWLRRLMAAAASPPTCVDVEQAMRIGIEQSMSAGVTTVGDITRFPHWTRKILSASPIRAVSFGEVTATGTQRDRLGERLERAASPEHRTPRMHIGISPHAPYSIEPSGLQACAARAREIGAALCIHLAETADEREFTCHREGPFVEYLRELGVWDGAVPLAGCPPVELASRTGLLGRRTIVAHANDVTDHDIERLAFTGTSVVYCPRTHNAFGHPPHRFREMIAAGINVCVGTDSLASNPTLSILDELRFLRREHPDVKPEEILAMGTRRGALALGFQHEVGTLIVGAAADIAVIPLDDVSPAAGWSSIFESFEPPVAVFSSGEVQHGLLV